jgi:hypothetical protein
MPPAGFEPTIAENEPPHTHDLDSTATGIDIVFYTHICSSIINIISATDNVIKQNTPAPQIPHYGMKQDHATTNTKGLN